MLEVENFILFTCLAQIKYDVQNLNPEENPKAA